MRGRSQVVTSAAVGVAPWDFRSPWQRQLFVTHRPTPPLPETVSFEDWLVTQTSGSRTRRKITALMLDKRLNEVDFGASAVRAEFHRMLEEFEAATRGLRVRSRPLPFRTARTGRRPALDLPEGDVAG